MAAPTERPLTALGNVYKLTKSELWFCSYGEPVAIDFGETDYLRVQFPHAGGGSTRIGNRTYVVAAAQGCVSVSAASLQFGTGFQQLVWRINRGALAQKLSAATGAALSRDIDFEPTLDLSLPKARALLGILHSTVHAATTAPESSQFLIAELEQAMMIALLQQGAHNYQHLLTKRPRDAASWVVRRVEEYIEAHLDRVFCMEDAVALTSCSGRSIYRTFQRDRGYSPTAFSKSRRLMRAHELLQDPENPRLVTDIALACGFSDFSHFSHFSRDFYNCFGVNPSAVKRPRRTD